MLVSALEYLTVLNFYSAGAKWCGRVPKGVGQFPTVLCQRVPVQKAIGEVRTVFNGTLPDDADAERFRRVLKVVGWY